MNLVPRGKHKQGWRRFSVGTAALAVTAVAAALVLPAISSAQAAPQKHAATQLAPAAKKAAITVTDGHGYDLPAGPKLKSKFSKEHIGAYINGGKASYCIDYSLLLDRGQVFDTVTSVSGMKTVTKEEVAYMLSRWGATSSNNVAAAESVAIRLTIGGAAFKYDWDHSYSQWFKKYHPSVLTDVTTIMTLAQANHGPYKLATKLSTTNVLPGDSFVLSGTVSGPEGGTAASLKFGQYAAKAVGTLPKTTSSKGAFKATFQRPYLTHPVVTVTAGSLWQSTALLLSRPAKGQQRLISSSLRTTTVSAKVTVGTSPSTPGFGYNCPANCNGNPLTTTTWTNKSAAPAVLHIYDNGKLSKLVYVEPHASVTEYLHFRDTHVVTMAVNYKVNGVWGYDYRWTHVWTIDCPPLPVVAFSGSCNCTSDTVAFSLPKNPTKDLEKLTMTVGTSVTTAYAKPGLTASLSYKHVPGHTVTVTVSSATQQKNGHWHTGNPYSVVLP